MEKTKRQKRAGENEDGACVLTHAQGQVYVQMELEMKIWSAIRILNRHVLS